jgi:hypothetical protein
MISFWHNNHPLQSLCHELDKLIPCIGNLAGDPKRKHLEKYRIACNVYYDCWNNGGWNYSKQKVSSLFKIGSKQIEKADQHVFDIADIHMSKYIINAAIEQNVSVSSLYSKESK